MVVTAASSDLVFLPSITTITRTPRVWAATSRVATESMSREWMVPWMVEPTGAASISDSSSVWMVKSLPPWAGGSLKCAQTG